MPPSLKKIGQATLQRQLGHWIKTHGILSPWSECGRLLSPSPPWWVLHYFCALLSDFNRSQESGSASFSGARTDQRTKVVWRRAIRVVIMLNQSQPQVQAGNPGIHAVYLSIFQASIHCQYKCIKDCYRCWPGAYRRFEKIRVLFPFIDNPFIYKRPLSYQWYCFNTIRHEYEFL